MPLLIEKPPKGFEKVLDASVAELVSQGAVAMATRSRPAVSAPIRVHHLGADAVAAGKGLAATQPTGWLAILTTDGEVRGTIELIPHRPSRKGAEPAAGVRFGGFTTGSLQRALAAAIEQAAKTAGRNKVEVSALRAPALYLLALWLRDEEGDRLVPIAPSPAPLKAGETYPADRALGMLVEAAKAVLEGGETRN
jgi:hypothetical protein